MKIIHLANWNSTNIGNGALIYGTERLLSEDAPFPITFIPEAWDDYTFGLKKFDENFVNLVNSTSDALMINGAVTFNAFRRFNKNTGMRFDLPLPLWEKIKVPMIFYGVSYRCWPFQEYLNKDILAETIRYAISKDTIFFGVRNDGTKEWISRELGIDSDKIIEVPDPGVFVPYEDNTYPELHTKRKNIIIAFNNEDAVYRFAPAFQKDLWKMGLLFVEQPTLEKIFDFIGLYKINRARIVRELARATEEIAKKVDAQFVLCAHYLDDYGMINEFINELDERIAHQLTVSTGLLKVDHTKFFYGRYKKVDLAISMRVHSMSPSIGLGIPVVPLTSQGRMRVFLKKIGLQDIAVDTTSENFSRDISGKALKLLADPAEFLLKTKKAVEGMRELARDNNTKIFALLKK